MKLNNKTCVLISKNFNFSNPFSLVPLLLLLGLLQLEFSVVTSFCTDKNIAIPALGREAQIGLLYDERTDKFHNLNLFRHSEQDLNRWVEDMYNFNVHTEVSITTNYEEKLRLLGLDKNAGVNILSGLTEAGGSYKMLLSQNNLGNFQNVNSNITGAVLYRYRTVLQTLKIFELQDEFEIGTHVNMNILQHNGATHVLTGIQWGASMVVSLASTSADKQQGQASSTTEMLKDVLKNLTRPLYSGASTTDTDLTGGSSPFDFTVSVMSDIPTVENTPRTNTEVKELLSRFPEFIQKTDRSKGVTMEFKLTPLREIRHILKLNGMLERDACAYKLSDISLTNIVGKFDDISLGQRHLQQVQKQLNSQPQCVHAETQAKFDEILAEFVKTENRFRSSVRDLLVRFRSGTSSRSALSHLFEQYKSSFSSKNINMKLFEFKKDLNKIDFCEKFAYKDLEVEIKNLDFEYLGSQQQSMAYRIYENFNQTNYVLFVMPEFIEEDPALYDSAKRTLFVTLNTPSSKLFVIDCSFDYEECEGVTQTMIKQNVEGKLVSIENKWNCSNAENGSMTCTCISGYEGPRCDVNTNDCAGTGNERCLNGATCVDGMNSFSCLCPVGYEGVHCEKNVDDCAGVGVGGSGLCQNGGTCLDGVNSFICRCAVGFEGKHCEKNKNDCVGRKRCMNGGMCIDGVNTFTCRCAVGYEGKYCQNVIDDCAGKGRCLHGGTCVDGVNDFNCICPAGFKGKRCELEAVMCTQRDLCQNGGTCVYEIYSHSHSYSCICPPGFKGENCQIEIVTYSN